ncbi:MAG: hypothetical protein Q8P15_01820 [Nanoarchaeota archaeon]|nr:hypothetical protein [Nanoarchaeota archaeon]
MAEKDTIFSSSVKNTGIFSFSDFYKFCYDWLTEETELEIEESKYKEKLTGTSKFIDIEWNGTREVTDYFKFDIKVEFKIENMTEVELVKDGVKMKTNKGAVQVKVKGTLVRDYKGKFETTPFNKFLRSTYERWVIPSRIEDYEEKLFGDCDEFLSQVKAFLDLEGKR